MSPQLFFRMLAVGRVIERRRNFRSYYEFSKISLMPLLPDNSRKELMSYYWNESLNDSEKAARDRVVAQAKLDAEKTWAPPGAALDFFRKRT